MRADHTRAVADFPPALRFLIAASRSALSAADIGMSAEHWQQLPGIAHRHGLAAALPAALDARTDVPSDVRQKVHEMSRGRAVAALRGMAEAVLLTRTLDQAGVASAVLKGPAFSEWLYGDVAFRRFTDIDLLVAPAARDAAYEALRVIGYSLPAAMPPKTAGVIYANMGAWPLVKRDALPVDLHWRLAQRRFARALGAEDVLMDARASCGDRADLRVPSPTHTAVLTLLHAAKHLWCTLELVLSIARLAQRRDVDWDAAESLLRQGRGLRGAVAGLWLAEDLFGVRPPDAFVDLKTREASVGLRAVAISALLRPLGKFADRREERRAHRGALDRWSDRIRYDAWRIAAPTPLEWAWWPLPEQLAALYGPLRLVRLGGAAARGLLLRSGRALSERASAQLPQDDGATRSIHVGPDSPRRRA